MPGPLGIPLGLAGPYLPDQNCSSGLEWAIQSLPYKNQPYSDWLQGECKHTLAQLTENPGKFSTIPWDVGVPATTSGLSPCPGPALLCRLHTQMGFLPAGAPVA